MFLQNCATLALQQCASMYLAVCMVTTKVISIEIVAFLLLGIFEVGELCRRG